MSNVIFDSFDARVWAAEFMKTVRENNLTVDESLMLTWFANALMRGYDEHYWSTPQYKRSIRRILHPWWSWKRYFERRSTRVDTDKR